MSYHIVKPADFNGTITNTPPATSARWVPGSKRRRFTPSYILQILQEADLCTEFILLDTFRGCIVLILIGQMSYCVNHSRAISPFIVVPILNMYQLFSHHL
jgi:hypothetical protein